ncbi:MULTISPECIES: DUF1699 family protein [Methanohalophilus]|uniref:DUF1699 family protein n=3 Tax=Methanohalophilus TaxID=2175 RepID=A0A1L3PZT1_9EURY|nr:MULTISPECIES: DUF1699 family protein [Methanohalophilus]APH38128.1 hypothetical protein BHR79_00610 [Methanohalophilus halophilus]ATU08681.1 hypothetical protein BKM01_07800 [Methanohalophilus portucalensis]OJH50066.1 hypothetical protein MPF_0861 [Methanohalophilus portucalensis FDF-1]RNI11006.1 DUF1699 family protein [Methanohalophilus halophilus]RNI13145.1 DUF1699 family protein [Methanohalophilus portucalensis FDF-1]
MKIRVVSKRKEIETLDEGERVIHLAFRPSNKDIFDLVKRCKNVEVIQIPSSYRKTVSKSIEMFLEMEGIRLIEGDVWGHRKDINEYYSISPSVNERIKELKSEGMSDEEVARKIEREGKLNKDILLYILDNQ